MCAGIDFCKTEGIERGGWGFVSVCLALLLLLRASGPAFISHKVFIKSCCKRQFSHKSVNSFFTIVIIKGKLSIVGGN